MRRLIAGSVLFAVIGLSGRADAVWTHLWTLNNRTIHDPAGTELTNRKVIADFDDDGLSIPAHPHRLARHPIHFLLARFYILPHPDSM